MGGGGVFDRTRFLDFSASCNMPGRNVEGLTNKNGYAVFDHSLAMENGALKQTPSVSDG